MELQKLISVNPSKNYEIIGKISISSSADIACAIDRAKKAQPAWAALDTTQRIQLLETVYQAFITRKDEIVVLVSREMGMSLRDSNTYDFGLGLAFMRGYLDNANEWLKTKIVFENETEIHYISYEPRGIAAVSMPWNYPFCNFIWGVMQNLLVGNTVVFKHSEECPLTGKLLEDIMQSAGLPEGVFNEVYGDGASVGEALMNSAIDLIHFTGSTRVGKHLYQIAAQKFIPAILELGGSAPGIIFEDANLDVAIESIYLYRFLNNGQTCDALKRLIVHKSLFNTIVERLKKVVESKKIGVAENQDTDLGPLVAQRQLVTIENQVADAVQKGAQIITGGKRPKGLLGAYYEPTILTNISFESKVWNEEVFGPVLPVVSFDSENEAIALANDTQYGLGGYIYTQNKERALRVSRRLQTGNMNVNDANYVIAQDPFGGYKNSGLGREHGQQGFRELCNTKVVALKK